MYSKKNLITISVLNPITVIIFLAFFFAKIFDKIDWSWWWVFSPLWIPTAVYLLLILLWAIVYLSLILIEKLWK